MPRKEPERSARDYFPPRPNVTLQEFREAAAACQGCDLWKRGTQTVFGEGPIGALVMFVGEQPGDYEDRLGRPFVGPAGKLLDRALARVGIDRADTYATNVVKHFKWVPQERPEGGTTRRRLHEKPNAGEIRACRPWLQMEIELVRPQALVLLGATPAQALLGRDFRVTKMRGKPVPSDLARYVMATVHPSSILRAPDDESRREGFRIFVADMLALARAIGVQAPAMRSGIGADEF